MSVNDLISAIARPEFENVFNPWSDNDPLDYPLLGALARQERLARHFDCVPQFLLIGEAPGYQGCRFSGVPFTNEKLIMAGVIPRVSLLGGNGRITTRLGPWSEPSATVMWRVLHHLGIATSTVMWNAFAWHPHKPGEPYSNRAPSRAELSAGLDVLKAVLNHFQGVRVVAVGRVSQRTLDHLGVPSAAWVRHPSMGGASEFEHGMRKLVGGAR